MNQEFNHPAQLWLGSRHTIEPHLVEYLQEQLCPRKKCGVCATCFQIREKQHLNFLWLAPEKRYSLESIEPIFERIAFQLEAQEKFFFIIESAEQLSIACQNALLKSVEEPPRGYHFIFCTDSQEQILPTLASRCILNTLEKNESTDNFEQLFGCFVHQIDPLLLLETLQEHELSEDKIGQFVELLLEHYATKLATAPKESREAMNALAKSAYLLKVLDKLPMPGSGKLFLKNLFLHMQR